MYSNLSPINSFTSHWEKATEKNKICYTLINQEGPIDRVTIESEYALSILFEGKSASKIFNLIKDTIDGNNHVDAFQNRMRLRIREMYMYSSHNPNRVRTDLDKIYSIISVSLPVFSEIIPNITKEIENIGIHTYKINFLNNPSLKFFKETPANNVKESSSLNSLNMNSSTNKILSKRRYQIDNQKSGSEVFKINGKEWTRTINNFQYSGFNNYSKTIQHGPSSSCEYHTSFLTDESVTSIIIQNDAVYYPQEEKVVTREKLIVKSNQKTLLLKEDPWDIREELNFFVQKKLLDQEFIDFFLK